MSLTAKNISHIVFIVAISILVIVMAVASYVFISLSCKDTSINSNCSDKETLQTIKIQLEENSNDNSTGQATIKVVPIKEVQLLLDSVNNKILQNQEIISDRQADLINDIRQETNNNLDKHSAWLAFWITVLGFIGVACPIAYQFLNSFKMEKELNEFRVQLREEDERRKTLNEAYDIKMNTVAFVQFCENRLVDLDDGCIRQLYICSLKEHYHQFLNGIEKESFKWKDLKIHICSVLININTFLFKFRQRSGYDESKRIKEVLDQIESVLKKVALEESLANIKDYLLKIRTLIDKI